MQHQIVFQTKNLIEYYMSFYLVLLFMTNSKDKQQQNTPEHIKNNHQLLIEAIVKENARIDEIKNPISISDPIFNNSEALREAAFQGLTEYLQLLIPVSNPKANNSQALCWAAQEGHIECVTLLIPVSNPTANESYALTRAVQFKRTDIIKLLIPVSDVNTVLQYAQEHNFDTTVLQQCIDEYEALQQKDRLSAELHKITDNKKNIDLI